MKEPTSVAVADGVYTISPTIVGDTFGDRGPGAERKHDVDDWRQWHVVVERVGARLEDHDVDSVQRVVYFGQDPDLLLLVLDVDFVVRHVRIEPGFQETFQAQTGVQSARCHPEIIISGVIWINSWEFLKN